MAIQRDSCAVLTFEPAGGVSQSDASLVSSKYAMRLARTRQYAVTARYWAAQRLSERGLSATVSDLESAMAAARVLAVEYTVFGSISKTHDGYSLRVSLANVEEGRILRTAESSFAGSLDRFMEAAIPENVDRVLGIAPLKEAPMTQPVVNIPETEPVETAMRKTEPASDPTLPAVEPQPEAQKFAVEPVATPKPLPPEPSSQPEFSAKAPVEVRPVRQPTSRERVERAEPDALSRSWDSIRNTFARPLSPYIVDHLVVGTRMIMFILVDDSTSIGTIDKLKETQDFIPLRLFAQYIISSSWAVELAFDKVEAKSHNSFNDQSDGEYRLSGPLLSAVYSFQPRGKFEPFAGAGLAYLTGSFDHAIWWRNGFDNEQDYYTFGPKPRLGKTREMFVDDTLGFALFGGADYRLAERFSLECFLRYMRADTEVSFDVYRPGPDISEGPFSLTMDYVALGMGAKYSF